MQVSNGLQFLRRYPTVVAFLLVAAGVLVARHVTSSALYWSLGALALPLLLLPIGLRRESTGLLWCIGALLFFLSGLGFALMDLAAGENFLPSPRKQTIHAKVAGTISSAPERRVLLLAGGSDALDGSPLPGSGRLSLTENYEPICAGDRIAFRSYIKKPTNRGNPGEYNWEMHCKSEGILWLASVSGEDSILILRRAARYEPRAMIFRLREAMSRFLEDRSRGDTRAVLKGIVIGDRGEIDSSLNRNYAQSGLAHLLAASGLNVGMVAVVGMLLVRCIAWVAPRILLLWPLKKISAAASVPGILIYCLIVGANTPIMRATIMGLVFVTAVLLDRRWYSPNSLALAGVILLLIYPLALFTPSFQLSFAAVLGILVVVPHLMNRLYPHPPRSELPTTEAGPDPAAFGRHSVWPRFRPVLAIVLTSLSATLAVTPFLAMTFHSFPAYTLPANLIAVPLMAVALPIGLIAALAGIVAPEAGGLILVPADVLVHLINEVARFCAHMPGSVLWFPPVGPAEFVLLVVGVLCILWFMSEPRWRRLPALFVAVSSLAGVLVVSPWIRSQGNNLMVVFLNVGKGDAAFIQTRGYRGLLIDGGVRNRYFDAGTSVLVPFFESSGIRSVEGIIMTHPEMDHMGGLLSVIERAPPAYLWWNAIDPRGPFLQHILSTASSSGTRVLSGDRNTLPVEVGKGSLRFLNPPAQVRTRSHSHKELNNASVVFRLDYGEISFLFTGDIEQEAEEELLRAGLPLRASVLKVAHHGCKQSTGGLFIEAVRPHVAIISCDDSPAASCPDRTVLQRLHSSGADVLWTGRHGAVIIETDGKQIDVRTARDPARLPALPRDSRQKRAKAHKNENP